MSAGHTSVARKFGGGGNVEAAMTFTLLGRINGSVAAPRLLHFRSLSDGCNTKQFFPLDRGDIGPVRQSNS